MPARSSGPLKWLLALIVVPIALGGLYLWFVLGWSYSSGERAGYVQKLSHKGWVCKTWEGEVAMVAVPGSLPEKFHFTVWDDKTAESINRSMGRRVTMHYEQKVGIPTTCFGDTPYIVTRVEVVEEPYVILPGGAPVAAPAPPPAPAALGPSGAAPPVPEGGPGKAGR